MSVQWSEEFDVQFRAANKNWALAREVRKWKASTLCCSALAFIAGWGLHAWLR